MRAVLRAVLWDTGRLVTTKSEKLAEGQGLDYKDYFQFQEPIRHIPPHRILAINRGENYLLALEKGHGNWEHAVPADLALARKGGTTALVMLALLNAGVPPDHEAMKRGLDYLRKLEPEITYTVGLQTMVYCLAGQESDKGRIQRNVAWLLKARKRIRALTPIRPRLREKQPAVIGQLVKPTTRLRP